MPGPGDPRPTKSPRRRVTSSTLPWRARPSHLDRADGLRCGLPTSSSWPPCRSLPCVREYWASVAQSHRIEGPKLSGNLALR